MSQELRTRIRAAVRALAESRGASLEAIALQVDLMTLSCVVADGAEQASGPPDASVVAAEAVLLLEEAANSLEEHPHAGTEPNRAAAARAMLGLESGTRGKPLRGRKGQPGRVGTIARWLNYQPASIFKPGVGRPSVFDTLIDEVTDYVVRREVAHLVAERHLAEHARRPPLESAMRIDWLGRFERYYAIWSYIAGIRYDVDLAVAAAGTSDEERVSFYSCKSLWYYARFVTELESFTTQHGGLWVTPDPAAEQRIADAVWLLREPTPFTELDDSLLRLAALDVHELAIFFSLVETEPTLRALAGRWQSWIEGCSCADPNDPNTGCEVHAALRQTRIFMEDVNRQWDLLADWYDVPRPGSRVDPPGG
jgi:hypothetical protein